MRSLSVAALLLLTSCVSPDPTFVRAARDFHDAVAPEYVAYVQADAALTPEQRALRLATVARFVAAISSREVAK